MDAGTDRLVTGNRPVQVSGFFMTVAIIGAGMAGLACARTLADRGANVRLFEKSRGLGGRCATRRDALHGLQFDHGVQFVRAKGGAFGTYLDSLRKAGTAMHWPAADGDGKKAYVTVPGMSALARPVAQGLDVMVASRIISMSRISIGWTLIDESGTSHGPFDAVILAIPAPQAAELLGSHRFGVRLRDGVAIVPCLAAMFQFASDVALADVVVPMPSDEKGQASALSWIARDSAKPGREPGKVSFVLHAARHVSLDWLEREPSESPFCWRLNFARWRGIKPGPSPVRRCIVQVIAGGWPSRQNPCVNPACGMPTGVLGFAGISALVTGCATPSRAA
jgi:renalase